MSLLAEVKAVRSKVAQVWCFSEPCVDVLWTLHSQEERLQYHGEILSVETIIGCLETISFETVNGHISVYSDYFNCRIDLALSF